MAENRSRNGLSSGNRRQPSRLQRRAPASLQIAQPSASQWNVAIPFLSPLDTSPTSPDVRCGELAVKLREEVAGRAAEGRDEKNPMVFKKWQHPATPFCYEPAPLKPSFMPV